MLELKGVWTYYDRIPALRGVSLAVREGEIVTLIGANGAGKSTTLNTISGLVHPRQGEVLFAGQPIHALEADQIVRMGICQVPEGRRVFRQMSVRENLEMGALLRTDRAAVQRTLHWVHELFPRLAERARQPAGTLSGGEQQMLAMGRALMSAPRLLLLDEPSMGLAPLVVQDVFRVIREINRQGVTVLLVEQNAKKALALANRAYVLETGEIVRAGAAADLMHDPMVEKAYLGM